MFIFTVTRKSEKNEFEIVDIDDDAEFEAVAAEFDKIMDEQE